uniref:Uncharacterized protein n=1 Tax=Fagus sylvatica TaxID=28930 RepID=A0A2N9GB09_FAGSY
MAGIFLSDRRERERERSEGFFLLWVTNSDRGREQVDLVHFPLPSPPLSLSFVGTATSSLSANRWVL